MYDLFYYADVSFKATRHTLHAARESVNRL